MSQMIHLSDETFAKLQRLATPFVDTPETVITRLADQALDEQQNEPQGNGSAPKKARRHISPGRILPVDAYRTAILAILERRDGAVPRSEVLEELVQELSDKLTPDDYEPTSSGVIRWRSRAGWTRHRMTHDEGLLQYPPPAPGVWALTEKGWQAAKAVRSDGA